MTAKWADRSSLPRSGVERDHHRNEQPCTPVRASPLAACRPDPKWPVGRRPPPALDPSARGRSTDRTRHGCPRIQRARIGRPDRDEQDRRHPRPRRTPLGRRPPTSRRAVHPGRETPRRHHPLRCPRSRARSMGSQHRDRTGRHQSVGRRHSNSAPTFEHAAEKPASLLHGGLRLLASEIPCGIAHLSGATDHRDRSVGQRLLSQRGDVATQEFIGHDPNLRVGCGFPGILLRISRSSVADSPTR